jgi:PTH2 family peptidyl-tRNA hydrolase
MMKEYKQVIVIRSDLKLSRGKLSAQAAHASLEAYKKADGRTRSDWEGSGSKKVVVKTESLKGLMEIYEEARQARLPASIIRDAGRTELPAGTVTAVGIGPGEESQVDKVTGRLKML